MSTSEYTIVVTSEVQEINATQKLLKVHEQEETGIRREINTKIEIPTTYEHIDSISASYDTNFPSLSASSIPAVKPSLAWVTKSDATAVRSGGTFGSVNENRKSATVTELLELPASQQLQKKEFGNKTTTVDVVKRVRDKTNTHIEVSTGQRTGNTTFLIKGKHEDVMRAKRDLLDSLAVKSEEIIQIPISARRYILGSRGITLQSITSKTGTRIQLPPRQENHNEEKSELDYDEDEAMMDVKIEGDAKGISLAKEEIEAIVNNRVKTMRVHKISHIEHQYYPLISGAHNARISQIINETGARIHVPSYLSSAESTEGHEYPSKDAIVISGEKEAVKKASDKIEEIYEGLKSNTITIETNIPKRQHKYLIGQKGSNLQEILEKTGCSLELAPPFSPSEKVIIRGPQNQLPIAFQIVMEKANSIQVQTLDITNIHKTDQPFQPLEHAKNILKYLWNRNKLKKIESETGIQITVPKGQVLEKVVVLEFVGKVPEEVELARKEVSEIVKGLPQNYFAIATIEPHLHRHIIGRKGQNLQRVKDTYGVEIIVPDEKDESPDILIVFEGRDGDEIPSDRKKKETHIKDTLEKAKTELIKAGQDAADFATQTLTIPIRFHRYIIGPKGNTLNKITGGNDAPVSVKFGSSRTGAAERSANAEGKKVLNMISDDIVVIKGPTDEVERVVNEIKNVVDNAKHIEIMNSYTEEFTFPAQFSAHVIGKGGAHVNRLKESLSVKIDIEGGAKGEEKKTNPGENVKVTIMGMKNNVEKAKEKILDLIDKLQDATVVNLKVPVEYHKSLIGAKGRYVKRLEEKYGVHIRFPRTNQTNGEGEEDATCVQKSDEVIIKGGRKGVNDAKTELLDLLNYERDHDHSINFTIPAKYLPHIVGKNGSRISEIKFATFTRIDLGRPEIPEDGSEQQIANVVIHGTKSDICNAQEQILNIVKELENQITIIIHIDPQHHKYLIGPGGSRIRDIVTSVSESEERSSQTGVVKFPRPGDNSDEVILKGDKNLVEKVKLELERLVEEQNNLKVGIVQIPRAQHPIIIGRNASQLREIQTRFNVEIQFPGSRSYHETPTAENLNEEIGNSEEAVKIIGTTENIEAAKAEILSRIRFVHTVNIPRKFHSIISEGGAIRKLRNEYHVVVDHGEEVPPEKIDLHISKLNEDETPVKRIDDDDVNENDQANREDFRIIENYSEEVGDISWNLNGEKSQVEKAELYLKELLEEASKFTHTGYITVPQQYHRHIIGRGGATITRIRNESGCKIDVPKDKGDDTVIVTGSPKGIEEVYRLLNEVVERAGK